MLVITNRLFALAPNFPAPRRLILPIYYSSNQQGKYGYILICLLRPRCPRWRSTAKYWQQALQDADVLLARQIIQLASGQPVLPCRYEAPADC